MANHNRDDYGNIVAWKKREFNLNGWNAMDIKAEDLIREAGGEVEDLSEVIEGMKRNMLQGDQFVSGEQNSVKLTVRYYCDNLSESRGRMFQ